MNSTTRCPACNTRFRISLDQLEAYDGMVRCGRCQAVFNARDSLQDDQPAAQIDVPMLDHPAQIDAPNLEQPAQIDTPNLEHPAQIDTPNLEHPAQIDTPNLEHPAQIDAPNLDHPAQIDAPNLDHPAQIDAPNLEHPAQIDAPNLEHPAQIDTPNFEHPAQIDAPMLEPHAQDPAPEQADTLSRDSSEQESSATIPPAKAAPDALDMTDLLVMPPRLTFDNIPDEILFRVERKPRWPWAVANMVLLVVLFGQMAYFYRIQIAASMPGLKPALVSYCHLLKCTVPLPRQLDQMSIESSDLAANPDNPNQITLSALLRNQSRYAQTYPNLQLTLDDEQNHPVARRTFSPAEYLGPDLDEQQGFLPDREINIALNLDTTDLKAAGYRLFLLYSR